MFSLNHKNIGNSKLSNYIEEQNKQIRNNLYFKPNIGLKVSDLVKQNNPNPINPYSPKSLLIFMSLISFLAGYNFHYIIKRV